jgi:hypothetical protein
MGSNKMNFSLACKFAADIDWKKRKAAESPSPIKEYEFVGRGHVQKGKWDFDDFVAFILEHGYRGGGPDTVFIELCRNIYMVNGNSPGAVDLIIRFYFGQEEEKVEMFREYVADVKWQFAKTYAKTSPHEYTVGKWKPEYQDKMVAIARFIKASGELEMFNGYPYVVYFLDGWKYWTMSDTPAETTLINRTPVGGY